jgi:hypothetical protein
MLERDNAISHLGVDRLHGNVHRAVARFTEEATNSGSDSS